MGWRLDCVDSPSALDVASPPDERWGWWEWWSTDTRRSEMPPGSSEMMTLDCRRDGLWCGVGVDAPGDAGGSSLCPGTFKLLGVNGISRGDGRMTVLRGPSSLKSPDA
jgi:hypothetical protein